MKKRSKRYKDLEKKKNKGKMSIEKAISDEISAGATDLVFTSLNMYGNEEFVTEVGRYSLNVKNKGEIVMSDSGKYIVLWTQVLKKQCQY